jgi:arsenite methyltransferase
MIETTSLGKRVARAIEGLDVDLLRSEIRKEYEEVAIHPDQGFHFHTGRPLARILQYEDAWLETIPKATIAAFAGTGNPFSMGLPAQGEHVVDVGSGAGIDSLIAARMVGLTGQVIGVDMTPAMLARARSSASEMGLTNVDFHEGYAEALPLEDNWADVVISNGVMNLFPDKFAGLREMVRVLKPGGRLQVGDILVQKPVGEGAKRNIDLWKGWIAGALLEAELEATVVAAGFVGFEITWRAEVFAGAPQSSSAAKFGTLGINFRARKALDEGEWADAIERLRCSLDS